MSDDQELGPAMASLNEKQRKFVMAMVEFPGITQKDAAIRAGYSDLSDGAKVRGHLCAHNPAVQAAIREVAGLRLNSNSLLAADVLIEIASDEGAPTKDRLKAAGMLLDRTGFGAAQTINVNKTVTDTTDRGIEDRIRRAAGKLLGLGSDPGELLGLGAPAVVEGEFSEVEK